LQLNEKVQNIVLFYSVLRFFRSPLRANRCCRTFSAITLVYSEKQKFELGLGRCGGEDFCQPLGLARSQGLRTLTALESDAAAMRAGGPFTLLGIDKKTIVFRDVMRR